MTLLPVFRIRVSLRDPGAEGNRHRLLLKEGGIKPPPATEEQRQNAVRSGDVNSNRVVYAFENGPSRVFAAECPGLGDPAKRVTPPERDLAYRLGDLA